MKSELLITGANGFVGRHLISYLLSCDEYADWPITGGVLAHELEEAAAWSASTLSSLPRLHQLKWRAVDITSNESMVAAMDAVRPRLICHLAARASGADSDKAAVFQVNVEGTRNLLRATTSLTDQPRVLLISTGYAYGPTNKDRPALETDTLAPQGIYGAYTDSKIAMESIAQEFQSLCIIARSFSHTGPGQTPSFAVASFARQLALIEVGEMSPEIMVGNLDALRDMLDVRDVVRAYARLLNSEPCGETVNVSSGKPYQMRAILDLLRSFSTVPTTVRIDPERLRPSDIPCSTGNPDKLRELIGWFPTSPLETALQDTLAWWRTTVRS